MLKKNKKTKNVEPLRDYDSQNNFWYINIFNFKNNYFPF
jgi:hypothetical protein